VSARQKLVSKLPITGELLRGSLLERTVAQQRMAEMRARRTASSVCITVSYAEGRTRQFIVRRERATEVRRWLSNYQQLKEAIEAILRCDASSSASAMA
jgi:hypothetical protein